MQLSTSLLLFTTGFNDDVLKQIIKMYLVEPKERKGTEMKPYLSSKPYVADIDYEERRIWLESQFKYITSNRGRQKEKPEVKLYFLKAILQKFCVTIPL